MGAAPRRTVLEDTHAKCASNYCRRLTLSHHHVCPCDSEGAGGRKFDTRRQSQIWIKGQIMLWVSVSINLMKQMRMDRDLYLVLTGVSDVPLTVPHMHNFIIQHLQHPAYICI